MGCQWFGGQMRWGDETMSIDDGEDPADLSESSDEEPVLVSPAERRLVTQPLDLSVQTLFDQWGEKLLILPEIQREYVWDNGKASRLIESLLLNIPIPVLYFAENEEAKYEIFDGHQRTRSIVRYMNNEFPLIGLSVLKEYRGRRYHELPEKDQRFFRMRTLRVIVISIESHPNMKFEIYERLNTGSILLNAQELRNSIYRGPLNKLLHELVKEPIFRSIIGTKLPRNRMVDEEITLRFLAMHALLDKYRPSLKRFLNEYALSMKGASDEQISEFRALFFRSISLIQETLGISAFRVLDENGDRVESTVNRALFEAQMLAFSWVNREDSVINPQAVRMEVAKLFVDEPFMDAIQRATGDRSRTMRRLRETVAALTQAGMALEVPFDLSK